MNVKTETMQDNTSQQEINQSAKKQSENLKPNPVGDRVSTIFAYVLFIFAFLFIAALGWFLANYFFMVEIERKG